MIIIKKFRIDKKEIEIMKEDWNYLIILDACRFDYFKNVYKCFFKSGKLKKAISPCNRTIEFLIKIFKDSYFKDIVYVSSNTFVNSKQEISYDGLKFYGKKHFYKVIDVWDFCWDKKLGTVHPKKVNEWVFYIKKMHPKKKLIAHYMQPHRPYITNGGERRESPYEIDGIETPVIKKWNILRKIRKEIYKLIGNDELVWKIESVLNIPPTKWKKLYYNMGKVGIKNSYKNDLRLVLKYVKDLVDNLPGKFLIISDHGEFLGEGGKWGHGKNGKECFEVPWFEIENKTSGKKYLSKVPKGIEKEDYEIKDKIKKRLESFGYLD